MESLIDWELKTRLGKRVVVRFHLVSPLQVGRDGIEPPTQGFSVLCSTD